jgi:hypothetical protein
MLTLIMAKIRKRKVNKFCTTVKELYTLYKNNTNSRQIKLIRIILIEPAHNYAVKLKFNNRIYTIRVKSPRYAKELLELLTDIEHSLIKITNKRLQK